jgi:hypothetical protein
MSLVLFCLAKGRSIALKTCILMDALGYPPGIRLYGSESLLRRRTSPL